MKIWLLLSRLEHGGLERVQINLAKTMHARGLNVCLVVGRIIADTGNELPVELPVIEIARAGRTHFLTGLIRALRRERPDIVFTTSNDVACLMLMLRLVAFGSMRVIVTQHSSLHGPRHDARGLKRVKLEVIRAALRLLLPKANHVVAVSCGVAEDMRQEFSLRSTAITVIHNPIVTPDFDERMHESAIWPWLDRDVPTIVFVGRLSTEKRLDLLLGSFQALIRTTPARLLIVGVGVEQQEIERRIEVNELHDCCKLTGFIHNALPLIRASDVLVLPSDYEGFGNVLVEAMACGTQVIATDCPHGPSEILVGGQFGQLIPTNNRLALEAAMRNSLDRSYHIPSSVLKARAAEFGLQDAADRYVALLNGGATQQPHLAAQPRH